MTTARKPRIAVIGGGIAGVSAAWQLRQQLGDQIGRASCRERV